MKRYSPYSPVASVKTLARKGKPVKRRLVALVKKIAGAA